MSGFEKTEKMNMDLTSNWNPFLIIWWPHSGCRWLNRSLLASHPKIETSEFVMPFLTHSTDMLLSMDRTSQVHKARSLPELAEEFRMLQSSVSEARRVGVFLYFKEKRLMMEGAGSGSRHGGVLSLGSPEPLYPDLELLYSVLPNVRIIHLVRHPYDCFLSMKSRKEMDSNPYKVGASWLGINTMIRRYCTARSFQSQYCLLRYEDLVRNTESELQRLCGWIGVPFDPGMLSGVTRYFGRNQGCDMDALTDEAEKDSLMAMVHPELAHYGYGEVD